MDKIVLFGGTFDPVHCGHIKVAAHASEKIGADKVIFIPAKRSPHKKVFPVASDIDRFEMIQIAVADKDNFHVSDCELKRGDPSYTLDTVKYFRKQYLQACELYWLVGADTITDLDKWYCIEELVDICNLCVMYRAGFGRPDLKSLKETLGDDRVSKLEQNVIATPLIDVSSTAIREKNALGEDICGMVDENVLAYIKKTGLYS